MNLTPFIIPGVVPRSYYRLSDKDKRKCATRLVANAKEAKRFTNLPCCECGKKVTDAHHEDYKKPLEVVFLCRRHHKQRHSQLGWGISRKYAPGSMVTTTASLSPSVRRKLVRLAKQRGVTISEMVRIIINRQVNPQPA